MPSPPRYASPAVRRATFSPIPNSDGTSNGGVQIVETWHSGNGIIFYDEQRAHRP